MIKGIDISKWQGSIDWAKVKDQVDFVIMRAGYGRESSQKDERFEEYYAACEKYGIPKGIYWFSYADSAADAKQEAEACYACIKGKKFEYPIWFDYEAPESVPSQKQQSVANAVIPAFIDAMKAKGYYVGLYSYYSLFKNTIPSALQSKYDIWVAHYADSTPYTGHKMWQYSEKGSINGISGGVDVNYCYVDNYPEIIKKAGLNNLTATTTTTKPVTETAKKDYPITANTTVDQVTHYPYNSNEQLSEHFNVQEFKCKCGKNHDILISTKLIANLEKLFSTFDCSMIVVNSGYRCPEYDTKIGGFAGQHSTGRAADLVFYDKNKAVISTKKVSCAAQDLGLGGIANIDKTYASIHLDSRTSNFWKGNELVSNSTVTSDFYSYYGLSKTDVYGSKTPPTPSSTTTTTKPATSTTTTSTSSNKVTAGAKVTLNNTTLYTSATSTSGSKKSGTYYVYNTEVVNNKVRITNSASNVGKTPVGSYVTGWIDVSVITGGATEKKSLTAGTELKLNSTSLYTSSDASRYSSKKTGTYYVYDSQVVNGRIRITNAKNNVGKTPAGQYVSGWVAVSDVQ